MREEIVEQKRRIMRLPNLIMMGVPESEEGFLLAEEVLKVIYPEWSGKVKDFRIGKQNGTTMRPLRITFPNSMERNQALKGCKNLKHHPHLSKISVRKDLTKEEQIE